MRREWIAGLVLMALAAGYYKMAAALPRNLLSDEVGAEGFPKLLAIALFILAAMMTARSLWAWIRTRPAPVNIEDAAEEKRAAVQALFMLAIGVGMLVIVNWAGYPLTAALTILTASMFLKQPFSGKMVVISVLGGLFFWFFFVYALHIPMPAGIWAKLFL